MLITGEYTKKNTFNLIKNGYKSYKIYVVKSLIQSGLNL